MMKHITIAFASVVFLAFTACSSDKPEKAPKVNQNGGPEHPDDEASRKDLIEKLNMARSSCAAAYGPAVRAVAPILYSMPNPPPPEQLFTQGPGAQALAQTQPQQQECVNALNMAIYNVSKMDNGKYWQRPDVQKWFFGVVAGIGADIAQTFPPEALANAGFVKDMRFVGTYLVQSQVGPKLNPMAQGQISQAVGLGLF